MDLSDIESQADVDLSLNNIALDYESLRTPEIHNKYLKMLNASTMLWKYQEVARKKLYNQLWLYYSGKTDQNAPVQVKRGPLLLKILKVDLEQFIVADDEYGELLIKMEYQQQKIVYIKELLKSINNRNWNIRNAIEWKKFTQGSD